MTKDNKVRPVPTHETRDPNLSTENQPKGAARRASDTLDRDSRDEAGRSRSGSQSQS